MVLIATFDDAKEIVNAGSDKINPIEQFVHLFLEDVWAIAQSHRDALVFERAKGQYDSAEILGVLIQLQMAVPHAEI